MSTVRWLADVAALVDPSFPPDESVETALRLLQEGLEAHDAFLIYGNDGTFGRFGRTPDLGLTDVALGIVNHDLTSRRAPCAFDIQGSHVINFRSAGAARSCECVAALIPMSSPAGDMLVVRGPWQEGFGRRRSKTLRAVLPALALILERRLSASRAVRQRHQLSALANITRVLSESENLDTVLTSIAKTIAAVTGVNYVSIDLVNPDGTVRLRCFNSSREGWEQLRERWKRGASRPDQVRDEVLRSRKPMLFADAQNDERLPERGRNYFAQTLIRSTGVLPLVAKDEVLGVLSVASHRPLEFRPADVELLEGLAAQVASALKGIEMYQEIVDSRSELQRLNEQLQESMSIQHHLARTDPLTGIPNRRYLQEALEAECSRSARYGHQLSMAMVDIDHLKQVNDAHSHQYGDEVIRHIARLARDTCRQADVVARYGGDEFVFLLPVTGLEDAAKLAERFRLRLAERPIITGGGETITITVSQGVVEWDANTMSEPACLIDEADQALYAAKADGRNRTMVVTKEGARAA
jgi:diguanylate cyclase (GGDEF)-like protein